MCMNLLKQVDIDTVIKKSLNGITFVYYKDLACEVVRPNEEEDIERKLPLTSLVITITPDGNIYVIKGDRAFSVQVERAKKKIISRYIFVDKHSLLINATNRVSRISDLLGDDK